MYHFNISGDNLLMYDTHEGGDMPFYGKVYGSGSVILDGGNNAMTVDASLTTGHNTSFTYITGITTEATNTQFITFVDRPPNVSMIMWKPICTITRMCRKKKKKRVLPWTCASIC